MKRSNAGEEEQSTELDITPMIDCVFLLLIFFVVTMKYPQIERNMPANLPKTMEGKSETEEVDKTVRYHIRLEYDPSVKARLREAIRDFKSADNSGKNAGTHVEKEQYQALSKELLRAIPRPKIFAQGASVRSYGALDSQLLLIERTAKDTRVQIILDAAREVPFMFVSRVQEICSRRGFNEISFAAKKEE